MSIKKEISLPVSKDIIYSFLDLPPFEKKFGERTNKLNFDAKRAYATKCD